MSDYLPPLRDMDFLFNDVFDIPAWWAQTPALADVVDGDTARAIFEQAGKLIAEQVAPLNRSGDEQGCRWEAGLVRTPDGFADAYRAFRGRDVDVNALLRVRGFPVEGEE